MCSRDWFKLREAPDRESTLFLLVSSGDELTDELSQESLWAMMFEDDIVI